MNRLVQLINYLNSLKVIYTKALSLNWFESKYYLSPKLTRLPLIAYINTTVTTSFFLSLQWFWRFSPPYPPLTEKSNYRKTLKWELVQEHYVALRWFERPYLDGLEELCWFNFPMNISSMPQAWWIAEILEFLKIHKLYMTQIILVFGVSVFLLCLLSIYIRSIKLGWQFSVSLIKSFTDLIRGVIFLFWNPKGHDIVTEWWEQGKATYVPEITIFWLTTSPFYLYFYYRITCDLPEEATMCYLELYETHPISPFDIALHLPTHPELSYMIVWNMYKSFVLYRVHDFYHQDKYYTQLFLCIELAEELHWWSHFTDWHARAWSSIPLVLVVSGAAFSWGQASISIMLSFEPVELWFLLFTLSYFVGIWGLRRLQRRFNRLMKRFKVKEWSPNDDKINKCTWTMFWGLQILVTCITMAWGYSWIAFILQWALYYKAYDYHYMWEDALTEQWKRFYRRKESLDTLEDDAADYRPAFIDSDWYYYHIIRRDEDYAPGFIYIESAGLDEGSVTAYKDDYYGEEFNWDADIESGEDPNGDEYTFTNQDELEAEEDEIWDDV